MVTLTPNKGFSAQLSTGFNSCFSPIKYAVPTTHTLVGAVIGIGLEKELSL